ncbi:MAG: hemolysin family protein [Firmicutes bacterium]|nr:hemolysin family protein [Bacillota bacterium]
MIWALLLVLINGFFVAVEFAIVRARRTRIEQYVQQGSKRARYALMVIQSIDGYLSATQLGITLASLGLGWTAQRSIAPLLYTLFTTNHGGSHPFLGALSAVLAFLLVTFVQIVFGELAPKSLAIAGAEAWLMATALPLRTFYKVMFPAIWVLNVSAIGVLKLMRVPLYSGQDLAHSEEELRMLVSQSHESGVIDEAERDLFDNVFTFGDRVAREIMVPRTDMVCLFTDQTLAECLEIIEQDRHTRFPFCEDDKDHVVGMIHSKDLFSFALRERADGSVLLGSVASVARKLVSVPEAMGIDEVLKMLQRERSGLAIVIDEYGGTAGMVTLEDVLEELVGEIQDEFDEERPPVEELDGYLSIDARLLIEEVNEQFGFTLSDEEVDTVGGWVYAQLTEGLRTGLTVEHQGARFVVAETDNLRITRLHLYLPVLGEVGEESAE